VRHYDWTDYYDIVSNGLEGDVEFYTEMARQANGPVLELACGTGRISLSIALRGMEVVGIDSSEKMLQKARVKAEMAGVSGKIELVHGDMRTFELGRTFSLVMIPYRSFLHLLSVKDQMAAYARYENILVKADCLP
jgi:ubiquinone/menaquinone biosynthesis C-methylase UbiE